MMQLFMQTWYFTCGKSRGHTIFFASSKLVGHLFPFGRRSCQNDMFSSKHASVILCFTFISRAMSVTFRWVSSGLHPSYNGVPRLTQVDPPWLSLGRQLLRYPSA